MLLTRYRQSHSASQQPGGGQNPALSLLGTGHSSFPSRASKGRGRTALHLSEPRFSSNRDPPAPHLMVNAYGAAHACSFCAQMLPISTAIRRSLSDKLKPYVSCLALASTHSYSDRLHGSNAPVAAHEAGEARPSGSLLSGGSGEQQSKRPARTGVPSSLRGSAAAHLARHPGITGSTKERARRTGADDGRQTDVAPTALPLSSLAVSSRRS